MELMEQLAKPDSSGVRPAKTAKKFSRNRDSGPLAPCVHLGKPTRPNAQNPQIEPVMLPAVIEHREPRIPAGDRAILIRKTPAIVD